MTRYLASRFAGMVIVMLLVATLVFFITRLAPGDPAAVMLGDQATAADIAKLRTSYGLDKPLPLQFAYWLGERSEEHTSELQSPCNLVCRLLLEKKKHELVNRSYLPCNSLTARLRTLFTGEVDCLFVTARYHCVIRSIWCNIYVSTWSAGILHFS